MAASPNRLGDSRALPTDNFPQSHSIAIRCTNDKARKPGQTLRFNKNLSKHLRKGGLDESCMNGILPAWPAPPYNLSIYFCFIPRAI